MWSSLTAVSSVFFVMRTAFTVILLFVGDIIVAIGFIVATNEIAVT